MIALINGWFKRYFSDPQAVWLALFLAAVFAVVIFLGNSLLPVLAAIVIAYLLDDVAVFLERHRVPRWRAVLWVYLGFLALLVAVLFGLLPLLSQQFTAFFNELPNMIARGQRALLSLPEHYPVINAEQVRDVVAGVRAQLGAVGQHVLSFSLASIAGLITLGVYLVLLPLLVFFFLKDKTLLIDWVMGYLPRRRELMTRVWAEMDRQIGNYVRGKFLETLIVGTVSCIVFLVLGLQYAILLGALVGLSVIVPYVGAIVVTVPVTLIAFFQWDWGREFLTLMAAYAVIQTLDGTILVTLLFSEAVNLHPIAIIVAVLVFGGLWGFWGVFFAIPLATLVKALLAAWPRTGADAGPP